MVTWNNDTKSNNNCWTETYSTNVFIDEPNGIYFKREERANHRSARIKYQLKLLLRQKKMCVCVSISASYDNSTKQYVQDAKNKLRQAIESLWNNRFKLIIKASGTGCSNHELDIIFQIVFMEDNLADDEKYDNSYDFMLVTEQGNDREMVDRNMMKTYSESNIWTYAHEFGHMIGLPDEYSTDEKYKKDESISYIDPSGKQESMRVFYDPNKINPKANIMSTSDNTRFEERHGWPLAIEAQKLLRANRYKNASCTIRLLRH